MFTDTHCHLCKEDYDDIEKIINDAKESDVKRFIFSGADVLSNKEVIDLISKHNEVYGTLGLHPSEAIKYGNTDINFIEANLANLKIVAIGEIGLDYHYGKEDIEEQKELFEIQLKLAEKYNLPVVIHSRDATQDTIDILKKYSVKGVIHSFSGSYETANIYIKMGFVLGINGVITFKNSNLSDVIERIPLEYIILETDSPYLTPEPFRGKKNEPKNVIEIAKYIANLKNISLDNLAKITNENIVRIFDKIR